MPQKRFTSPGRTYRRSHVALYVGLILLATTTVFANLLGVNGSDLFSGLMAGAGAIGALMAAYESADAAEGAAEAARISNELTQRQYVPEIFVSPITRRSMFSDGPEVDAFSLDAFAIDNISQTYTCVEEWTVYIYINKKRYSCTTKERLPMLINGSDTIEIAGRLVDHRDIYYMDGFACTIDTIHGTRHGCIAWVDEDRYTIHSRQLRSEEAIPELMPME